MRAITTFLAILLQISLFAVTTTGTWTGATNSNWNNNGNWTSVPANTFPGGAAGDIANLTTGTPTTTSITLNGQTITLGVLNIDSGTGYTISGGGNFNFQATSGNATITITTANGNGSQEISATGTLTSPLSITQGSTGAFTYSGTLSGSGSVSIIGPQTVVFSGTNSYLGGTTLTGGTLSIAADVNLGDASGAVSIGNAVLQTTDTFTSSRTYTLTAGATIGVASTKTLTLNTTIQGVGSLTKSNSGTLVLGVANNYEGGTFIASGTLSIANDTYLGASSGSLNFTSGTLLTTTGVTSARSGSITGAAVIDTNGNTDTFSGSFTGAGSLTVQGGGTVILSGTNSYSGGTTIATTTTLQGNTASLTGPITLNTTSSSLVFSQNFDGTYTGTLSSAVANAGTITKSGSGAVTFSGTSTTFTGTVAVSAGSLIVNGTLANAAAFNVSSGATLGGSGTVSNVTNSGTLDPGSSSSSVGTLNVQGTLVLNAGSTVNINLLPLSGDQIAATGAATLNGALRITPLSGFYAPTSCYTILTASSVGGSFSSVVSTSSNFTVSTPTIGATTVSLCLTSLQPFFDFPYTTKNNEAVGNNINALTLAHGLSSDLLSIVNSFAGQSFSSINDALSEMNPSSYSNFTELQMEIDAQILSMFHRWPNFSCSCHCSNRIWVEPFGSGLILKEHGEQIGSRSKTGGIAIGYDREINPQFVLGVASAWDISHLRWRNDRGHGVVNGFYGGIYGDYKYEAFYLGASFLAGANYYDTSRHIEFFSTNRHAKAHFQAIDVMAQLATAYFFGSSSAHFYPYANFDVLYHQTQSYSESGANGLDLHVFQRSDSTFRTEMGLALQVIDSNYDETICISPLASFGWVNMCPIHRPQIDAYFEGGAPISFETQGWDETWNLLSVDFGLGFNFYCASLSLRYHAEVSPDSKTLLFNQYGNLRFDYKW